MMPIYKLLAYTRLCASALRVAFIALVAAVCHLGAATCFASAATAVAKDSGWATRAGLRSHFSWLDNQRIIFVGAEHQTIDEGEGKAGIYQLAVWNPLAGTVSRVAELSARSSLCVAGSYVRYQIERDGVWFVRYGEFGHTNEAELDVQAFRDGILAVSPVSCREYNPKLLRKRYGNWSLPLTEPGEYLDKTAGDYAQPMRYFPSDGSDAIALTGIPTRAVDRTPRYSYFKQAYVFQEIRRQSGSNIPHRVWLLTKDGNVEEITLPAGPWMAGSVGAMPARSGWVMWSHALDVGRGHGAAGIYLLRQGGAVRLMTGYPHGLAVSPDGCKVAASIETERVARVSQPRLWMVDMCSKGN